MNIILKKKYNFLKSKLTKINYINPLLNNNIYNKLNLIPEIEIIPHNIGFNINNNIIKSIGFYNDRICEVIMQDHIFSNNEILHLNNIIKICNTEPIIIELDNDYKIYNTYIYNKIIIPDDTWIAASHLKNYILKDTLLDYFKFNNKKRKLNIYNCESDNEINTFQQQIFNKGNEYEKKMINDIVKRFKNNTIIIGESYQAKEYKNYIKTKQAIENRIPIIFQATLWNYKNKTFGCADMLIRSDYINIVFPKINFTDDNNNDYQVFDFKWSKIQMLVNSDLLCNTGLIRVYKSQLKIYVDALNILQNSKINRSYIIAREIFREKIINKKKIITNYIQDNLDNINKLGIIDYEIEEIDKEIEQAIKWLNFVKNNNKLECDPPNDIRLYPNMKNQYDDKYKKIKNELAEKNKEITLLYNVNIDNRNLAINQGITRYDDKKLTCDILGITGKKRNIIDEIIDINRNNNNEIIKYNKLSNYGNWRDAKIKMYLDIETINNVIYDLGIYKTNFIFMIGLGIVIDGKWEFKNYITETINIEQENKIILELEKDINVVLERENENDIPIYHWGNFENYTLKPLMNNNRCIFYDMNKWFLDDGIYIKDALNYKLKTIIKALTKNNILKLKIPDINNGMNAMDIGYKYYQNKLKGFDNKEIMNNIKEYNELDCRSMFEIHEILKKL
jgi:hypothetical protein